MIGVQKNIPGRQKRTEVVKESAVTILTNGCHFKGRLFCRGSTRIGGKVEGEIVSEGLLIIEHDAMIRANIEADEAIIQGEVDGTLSAKHRVELCAQSHFQGEIMAPLLVIREGAQFNGTSRMMADSSTLEVEPIKKKNTLGVPAINDEMDDVTVDIAASTRAPEVSLSV